GAYLNDKRLRVAARKTLADAVVATGMPNIGHGDDVRANYLAQVRDVLAVTAALRRFGAASLDLCFVAAGRFDAFWESGLSSWDMAAGLLIVKEAGGLVTDLHGGERPLQLGHILAGNEHLHPQLLKLLKTAKP
ncbi:MAG TPA: inositol monophosphatase family protein, partial [Rhizomicrobium sp.]|nr:inositol monophosphatase family protein [Rhizomicrobium sp.]